MSWETVIGLEVHAQLNTKTKLFSNAPTLFGASPNSQANIIDAGFPGTLPVLNEAALHLALQFGMAVQGQINQLSYFERKNYFYPDLPKGYQISQFRRPFIQGGHIMIISHRGEPLRVTITHAHLEEDAGKLVHTSHETQVDLNRAGVPLLEIVTAPCLRSAEDVVIYLKTLNQLLRFLNICDGNMQEGSFRCDVNLSLKRPGTQTLGTRVELKNLNSFRFIEKAIFFEQNRQAALLDTQQPVIQETRLYHEGTNTTISMRDKENVNDYRYFPDPDLLPVFIEDSLLQHLQTQMPELPEHIRERLEKDGITNPDDIDYLLSSPALIRFYDACKQHTQAPVKLMTNWLKGPLAAALKEQNQTFASITVTPHQLGNLLSRVAERSISDKVAKDILQQLFTTNQEVDALISGSGYQAQTLDLEALKAQLFENFPKQIAQFQAGDQKVLAFLIGQAMKLTKGLADPKEIHAFLVDAFRVD
ncbi:MAG: Asp-tRNA(Asn)/Glu-tRNA(Gln) amidotransferase subunit GatB [Legionellales bacterium]|nr:Asp-tRNA(Asn)/Glu-tRNA(Gln) amidotransferase subunit GatB [Legionellales bacterium]